MSTLEQRILNVMANDGVTYETGPLTYRVSSEQKQVQESCEKLENRGLIVNDGDHYWERDDPDFIDIWKITPAGMSEADIQW